MTFCPKCNQNGMIVLRDSSGFTEKVCPNCLYYDSDSPAFKSYPELFRDLGSRVLSRLREKADSLARYGLTAAEAEAWLVGEPSLTRNVFASPTTPIGGSTPVAINTIPILRSNPGKPTQKAAEPP